MERKLGKPMDASRLEDSSNPHVEEVVRAAHLELRDLIRKRTEIMRRIGSVKRTIVGLASVFGDGGLDDEWLELKNRKKSGSHPGFTKTCRMILMEADRPLTAREVCELVKQRLDQIELRHKDPLASVTTVLNRLVEYGEAKAVVEARGRRAWQWIAEPPEVDVSPNETEKTLASKSSPLETG